MDDNSYNLFDLVAVVNFIIGVSNYSQNQEQTRNQNDIDCKLDSILDEIEQLRRDISSVSE